MFDDNDDRARRTERDTSAARYLATETGISENQARDLINMIGYDRPSLLREARIMKKVP
ncbi:hypothetical protein [Mesorhizobium sp. M0768]|uniref:hypothetical protein n=1 Tax=unclassified Mesorhizobium TaxID=325217 RepID=UPI003339080A